MYTCASCTIHGCEKNDFENLPKNCPMKNRERMDAILSDYMEPEIRHFSITAAGLEAEGYCKWPRLKETIEFCKRMGYERVGMAFCGGLKSEAKIVADLFKQHGISLISVMCKAGGYDKSAIGMTDKEKVRPGGFEPMCNPIAQAKLLNDQNTQFNIVLGLCVGHDSLFLKNADAPCTVLVAKDRALGNNPCAAIYTANTYCRTRLE